LASGQPRHEHVGPSGDLIANSAINSPLDLHRGSVVPPGERNNARV
jgi:hypothetical protein